MNHAGNNRWILSCLALCALVHGVQADPGNEILRRVTLAGTVSSTASQLDSVDKLLDDKQWEDAVTELVRLLEESGDDLVYLDDRRAVLARRVCQERLSRLPDEAKKIYRDKVDASALQLLKTGENKQDGRSLRRLVDTLFASSHADRALDLLGDMEFEKGKFAEALEWWSMLVPDEKSVGTLQYPDPKVDVARVQAKKILARFLQGADVRETVKAYRANQGKAVGELAGKKGAYADLLDRELQRLSNPLLSTSSQTKTFAGHPSRNATFDRVPGRLAHWLTKESPDWELPILDAAETDTATNPLLPATAMRSLAYFPIEFGNHVVVSDGRRILAYDRSTGAREVWHDLARTHPNIALPDKSMPPTDARHTLTASEGLLFARLGTFAMGRPGEGAKKRSVDSVVACLRLDGSKPRLCWETASHSDDQATTLFEGTPVVDAGRVFVASTRFDGDCVCRIHCLDSQSGAPLWPKPTEVCTISDGRHLEPRNRHHLLTLAGSRLVYCTHSGAIVAVDPGTGTRLWGYRYPSRGWTTSAGVPPPRDPAPCLYANGRILAAPADYDRVLCLDAATGRLLWESAPPFEVVHLIGMHKDRLYLTTTGDVRALDLSTGETVRETVQPSDGSKLMPFGRGLIAEGQLLWPTWDGLRVLNLETGDPVVVHRGLRGNLCLTDQGIAAAGLRELRFHARPGLFLEELRKRAAAQPESMPARIDLARAEADTGRPDLAIDRLQGVESPEARQMRRQLLHGVDWTRFDERNLPVEAVAHACLSKMTTARESAEIVRIAQRVLADPKLGSCAVTEGQGCVRTLRGLARHAIHGQIAQHGRSVYEIQERQAQALWSAKDRKREDLEYIANVFPESTVAPGALAELGKALLQAKSPGRACRCYQRILREHPLEPALESATRRALAEALSSVPCRLAAEHQWRILKERFGEHKAPGSETPMKQLADTRIKELALAQPVPREWHKEAGELLIPGHDGRSLERLYARKGESLHCLAVHDGTELWKVPCGESVHHALESDEIVLLGTDHGLKALFVDDGSEAWRRSWPIPCNTIETVTHGVLAGLVHVILDRRLLLAIDALTGDTRWQCWSEAGRLLLPGGAGRFAQGAHGDDRFLLVQDSTGCVLVLDPGTGAEKHRVDVGKEHWTHPPLALGKGLFALPLGLRHVALLDAAAGETKWLRELPTPSATRAGPQLLSNGKHLILLHDGIHLERLNLETGAALWERRTGSDPLSVEHMAIDADNLYFASESILSAVNLEEGNRRWQALLRGSRADWMARSTGPHVWAVPVRAERERKRAWLMGGYAPAVPAQVRYTPVPSARFDRAKGTNAGTWSFPAQAPNIAIAALDYGVILQVSQSVRLVPR